MKSPKQKTENPLKKDFIDNLPSDIKDEQYWFVGHSFSIPEALWILNEKNRETVDLNVEEWAKALGLDDPIDSKIMRMRLVSVDDSEAMSEKVNPDIPAIVANFVGRAKENMTLLIDGNKRLRKAFLTGRKTIKAYVLTIDETKKVKIG